VYRIGRVLPLLLDAQCVLVGRDARASSPDVYDALCRGIADAGANVDDMGLATTPMTYYFTGERGYAAAVMVTASHNPPQYNGLKISRRGAVPVGSESGLRELELRIAQPLPPPATQRGTVRALSVVPDYLAFLRRNLPDLGNVRFGIDASNGMAALLLRDVFGDAPQYLYDDVDGSFPNHSPNPLEDAATAELRALVVRQGLDIGVIFDGDADRVMFVDERGRFVRPDLLIALLAEYYLAREPGAAVLCDIRTSRGVTEAITRLGGVPHLWKVGHAFAKVRLRELNAIVGGELAGHYYFRDFHCCDAGLLCSEIVLGVVAAARRQGRTFSQLLAGIDVYANSGECNYVVTRKTEAMEALRAWALRGTPPTAKLDFDGYRFEWPDWWFNVRPSNTEPFLRLICEARSADLLAAKRAAIEAILAPFIDVETAAH
jgi:phosphomannomutase